MPSIPQSLLWISLVVLWLFVLVPMLISKRDAVRRTSDVALATRVLTSGSSARLLKRGGPATGHRSDPDWRPESDECDDLDEDPSSEQSMVVVAATAERAEPDYLDVDVVDEDSGALPVGAGAGEAEAEPAAAGMAEAVEEVAEGALEADAEYATEDADEDDTGPASDAGEYEYIDDTSGLEAEEEPATAMSPGASRRRRYDTQTAAKVSARKYEFRKRALLSMALVLVLSALAAFTVAPSAWWLCGTAAAVTVLYLAYLRRQTRIEEQVRARRMRRMARAQYHEEMPRDEGFEVVPSRLHGPDAAVLEIDDEDPAFEHLEHVPFARNYDWRGDLPRAAGQ